MASSFSGVDSSPRLTSSALERRSVLSYWGLCKGACAGDDG